MATAMSIDKKILILIPMMLAAAIVVNSQDKKTADNKDIPLAEIAARIQDYKNKTVTLRLKLKHVDRVFEKIYFYDKKNHDIEFDISSKETKKMIVNDMNDIHGGMGYLVTFRIRNIGKLNEVIADLLGFTPALLDSLPAGDNKK
jgi:hypothetical protein